MAVGRSKGHFAFSLNLEREQGWRLEFFFFSFVCNIKPDRRWAAAIACAAS
jgi:hypothetical protein